MAIQNTVETWVRGSLEGAQTRLANLTNEVKNRFDGLQARVVEAAGVASQSQLDELNRELDRLSKKIDALSGAKKGTGKSSARA